MNVEVSSSKRSPLALLSLAALGVVYGDIGTSPLYAVRECFGGVNAIAASRANVLGVLSLIVWSLVVVISLKYLVFVLRADNQGEGGILALASLLTRRTSGRSPARWFVVTLGLFGAALLYADGSITPAISVLSALEGLEVAAPVIEPYIEFITVGILLILFFFQTQGTARIGAVFGPIMLVWFLTMAALGILRIVEQPGVLAAINPIYAVDCLRENGWHGFLMLGAVFLVVTGGEALYADIGHFGTRPIRFAWFSLVLPALLLNYFGQGAFLITHPEGAANPFFQMAPRWAVYPLVGLATAAAVIASQAVITGAYSLTLQAIQLGYSPRLRIDHTSPELMGQIYVPAVNWVLLAACICLVLGFHSSSNLAAAYGVAITITMVITTVLFFLLLHERWKWPLSLAIGLAGIFLVIDLAFFGANITKVAYGGWYPLAVATVGYILMSTWMAGRQLLAHRLRERQIPLELYVAELLSDPPMRVPGIAVFMSGNPIGTPPALRHNVNHNHVLHEKVVILTVETANVPRVAVGDRAEIEEIGEGFYRIVIRYGFMDQPSIPEELSCLSVPGLPFETSKISYFLGRETLFASAKPGLARWREKLFVLMSRNAQPATAYYRIPPDRVIEVGVQVEL
jgi:KUP system potassium uptake protein